MTSWTAPHATGPVDTEITVPGSKSATARALVLSSLASGPGTITAGLRARDTSLMIAGLRALGARIDDAGERWQITPIQKVTSGNTIDCGLAGTVMRFLPPVAALGGGTTEFTGDEAASARPMGALVDGLRQLGVGVSGTQLPIQVTGPVSGQAVQIDSSASSQFISALLLSGPRFPDGVSITHHGDPIPSLPHIEMTVAALRARGVQVDHTGSTWQVRPGPIVPRDEIIEPDLTTAAAFLAAALVTGGQVCLPGWPAHTTQPGTRILPILEQMGAMAHFSEHGVTIRGSSEIAGIDIDLHETSELTAVVAALAALASGPSVIRGVGHIRGHETDRLAALSTEITALGGDCQATTDGLVIHPRPLHAGGFRTYADHRMAHAGALIGLRVAGVELDDVGCTSKTMPEFPGIWQDMVR